MKRRSPAGGRAAPGRPRGKRGKRSGRGIRTMTREEVRSLRSQFSRTRASAGRWNVDPHDAQRSLARLVLALVEFLRRLMERQAVRRMEAGTLSGPQAEDIGAALMRLERTIRQLARGFGLDPEDLNLDLGPLGRLH